MFPMCAVCWLRDFVSIKIHMCRIAYVSPVYVKDEVLTSPVLLEVEMLRVCYHAIMSSLPLQP